MEMTQIVPHPQSQADNVDVSEVINPHFRLELIWVYPPSYPHFILTENNNENEKFSH